MSQVIDADNMRYTRRHEWVMLDDDVITVGVTDHGQSEIPGVDFVEMPADGVELEAGEEAVTVEARGGEILSVLAPFGGAVVEVNALLEETPGLVNTDPYGDGWLFRLEVGNISLWNDLLTAEEYEAYVSE